MLLSLYISAEQRARLILTFVRCNEKEIRLAARRRQFVHWSRDGPGHLGSRGRTIRLSIAAFPSIIEGMKLLVVDDHPVLRGGLCALLLQIEKDVVVLQASAAEED